MPEVSGSLRESSLTEEEALVGDNSGTDDEHEDGTIPGNESNRAPRVQFDAGPRNSFTKAAAGASRNPPDSVAPSTWNDDKDSHNPRVKATKVVQGRWIRKVKGVRVAPAPLGAKVPVLKGHKSTPATGLSIYQIQRMKRHFGEEGTLHTEARKHIIERWTHTYLVLKLAIIAVMAVVLLFLGAFAEPLVSGRLVWVSGALLLFSTLIGIRGAMVVVRDIQRDDDGLETPGQRMLQVYFHIALAFVVLFLPFAIGLLRDPIGYEGDVLATLFEAGDALLWEEAKRLLFAAGFIGLIVALVILTSLQSVVKIVTFYEITQSFLETFSLTLIAFGILLIYLLLSLFKETQFLSSNEAETLVGVMDSRIILATICTVFVVGMSIIGFFAAWFESRRLLLFHAVGMAFLGMMIFTFGILILSLDWPAYIEGRCYQVVKTMSADWWMSALQCTKYGGTSIGALVEAFDDTTSTWVYLINGVGSAARCADSSQYAQAWEYAPITMANRTVDLVGCVNLACCSTLSSILSSMTFTIAFAFTLLLVGIFAVVFGDLWLRRETNKDTNNIKYFSRTRAFWILTMSTFLTLLAIIILTALLNGDLGRATEDLVLAEDIQQSVNKTSLLLPTGDDISPHSCSNQVRDGAETDIDCGGIEGQGGCSSEQRCRARQKCLEDSDCLTDLICDSHYQVCVLPPSNVTCSNGKRDVLETDVDCGGPSCPGCGNGQTCSSNADCYFLHCESGVCISCSDGIKNGDEADVDCGAQHCVQEASLDAWAEDAGQPTTSETFDNSQFRGPNGLCLSGARCSKGAQCEGGLCIEGSCASCSNGLLDGDETDVDCGGSHCQARCSAGATCSADSDCVSGTLCDAATSTCVWEANLTCAQDGVQNNDETDVDCGGEHNSCERCGESMQCSQNNDCASGICHVVNGTGFCSSCSNGIQDGDEAGVDCGGSMCASRCSVDDHCTSTSDCATGLFCWNEVNVDAAVQHYMQTHEVDSEATARAELATVFPSTGSCQVPFTLTIKALSPVFYMNTQVNYGDLFESEALSGLQLDGSSDTVADVSSSSSGGTRRRLMREREPRRRLRELASAANDGYVNSVATEEENTWPYLCNLTVQSALASTGTHFQIEDDGGATITTWNTSSQSGVDILIQHGDAFPLIYIVPTTCTDLRESEITTTWSVDASCESVNVESELEYGVASLLVPLTTSLAGYVRSSMCISDPSHVDCILITGVTVTLRSYRAGLCNNVMPAPLASCGDCVDFHYHQCVSDDAQACCYWEDSEEDNAAAISACLNDAEEFVQTETYTNQIPGLYFLSWPELYTDLSIASSHTVHIQFSKEGFQDHEAVITIPVGGMQFISDVYMEESGTDESVTDTSPTVAPTPPGLAYETASPTDAPVPTQTALPTTSPTSPVPGSPTSLPTFVATSSPTLTPTASPTESLSDSPTLSPTLWPSATPTVSPNAPVTSSPTLSPSATPTSSPTPAPNSLPISTPTLSPTSAPTLSPTLTPTTSPTSSPTAMPTSPTLRPTSSPTETPTKSPTAEPTSPTPAPTPKVSITPTTDPVVTISGLCSLTDVAMGVRRLQNLFDSVSEYDNVLSAYLEVVTMYIMEIDAVVDVSSTTEETACQLRCGTSCSTTCSAEATSVSATQSAVGIKTFETIRYGDDNVLASAIGTFESFQTDFLDAIGVDPSALSQVTKQTVVYASGSPNTANQYTTEVTVRKVLDWALSDRAAENAHDALFNGTDCNATTLFEVCGGTICNERGVCNPTTGLCECDEGYHGYQCQDTTWTFSRDCSWEKVYDQSKCIASYDIGSESFNEKFAVSGRLRYDRYGEPYAFYERLSDPSGFDAYSTFLEKFDSDGNLLHTDFTLHSTEAALEAGSAMWEFCDYGTNGVGFPGFCGPTSYRSTYWCSRLCTEDDPTVSFVSMTTDFQLYVCVQIDDGTIPSILNSTGTLSGSVMNEGGFAVAATIKLFKGTVDPASAQVATAFRETTTTSVDTDESPEDGDGTVSAAATSSLEVSSLCYPSESESVGTSSLVTSDFAFEDLPQGMYSLLVVPEDSLVYSEKLLTSISYSSEDIQVVVPSANVGSQLYLTFEYDRGDYGELELVVNFQISDEEDADECSIGISALEDGACACGDVQVASIASNALESNEGRFSQSIVINRLYLTVYRFFLRQRSTSSTTSSSDLTYRTDGRCGANFPLDNGRASQCPTEEILWDDGTTGLRPCCSQGGYCGSSERHCSCQLCMDYSVFMEDDWESKYRIDGACRDPLQPFDSDGTVAICPPDAVTWWDLVTEARPCCNADFQCGNSVADCTCSTCVDYRAFPNSSSNATTNATEPSASLVDLLQDSNAVVKIITVEGAETTISLPAAVEINFEVGENGDYDDASFVRLFCIDAQNESPSIHEYGAPRYFAFESEMMALDIGQCPGNSTCEFIAVSGIQANNELNGIFRRRYDVNEETYKAFPGYDISEACSTFASTITDSGTSPADCYSTCDASDACDGFVYRPIDESDSSRGFSCRYVNNISRCGGKFSSTDIAKITYVKTYGERLVPTKWYTHVDTLFSSDGQIHLYRDEPSALLGGMYTWFFDSNLNPDDGYLAFGVDAIGSGTPDGVVQWLVYSTAWTYPIFLAESPLTTLITTMTDSCDLSYPSLVKNFSSLACSCSGTGLASAYICSDEMACGTGQNDDHCRADPDALLDEGRYPYELQTHYQCGLGVDRSEMAYINFAAEDCDKNTAPKNGACRIHNGPVSQCKRICDKHPGKCAGFDYERTDEFVGGYNAYIAEEVDTGRCHFRTSSGMYFAGFNTMHDCYIRQARPDDGAICKPTKFPSDEPGTDFGCPPGFTYCGEGRYDPTQYTSCATDDATESCSTFQIRFAGTNYCLTRTRWSIRALQCDPEDPHQAWTLTAEGYLVGQGVRSQTEVFSNYYYTMGVNLSNSTSTAFVMDPTSQDFAGNFEPIKFRANDANELHGALDSDGTRLCFDADPVLGLEAGIHIYVLTSICAAFEMF